jgi:NAD(P)-dependent dehydrogenase (short-subunit alcohol dehydrogenase family)
MTGTDDIKGRVALITGASAGLGRHFAGTLARAGARVALAARRGDKLAELQDALAAAGAEAITLSMDVTDPTSVRRGVAETVERLGGIDILINNAGVTATVPLLDMDIDGWDAIMDTNLRGCFLVGQAAARAMRDRGTGGSIVNVASILGLRVAGQVGAYAASKAALVQLTRSMALELARDRIRVNALCPGYIATDLNGEFFQSPAGQALVKRIPMRRLGDPADLDGPLLLLCSDAGRYMTGAAIPVDGGHLVSSL